MDINEITGAILDEAIRKCGLLILVLASGTALAEGELAREELRTYLGAAADAVQLTVDASMPEEAWRVRGENGKISLRGGSERGLCYAAYEFLERACGIRWLTPWGDTHVPPAIRIPPSTFSYAGQPKLDTRWFVDFGYNLATTKGGRCFLFRQRHNIIDGDTQHPLTLKVHPPMTHNIFHYIPPSKYFKDHSEYFTQASNGKRIDGHQLCFSNADLQRELAKNFLKHVEDCGGKGVFDLTVRDLPGRLCNCPACLKAETRVGSIGGAYFEFVRRLGRVMEKRYPSAFMHFTAYREAQTEVPPNAAFGRFPSNCVVVFAPIDNDFSKDYAHANNRRHLENLHNWRRCLDRLWQWYYPLTYGGFTLYSGVRRCATDLTLAYKAGMTGGTFEHDVGTRVGAGFADLHTYMISRLYCDPELPWRPIAEEFCRLYYGSAAETVLDFMDTLDAMAENQTAPLRWDTGMVEVNKPRFLADWSARLDAAEQKLGGDGGLLQRLREFRLSLDLAVLRNWRKFDKEGVPTPGAADAVRDRALAAARAAVDRRFANPKVADHFFAAYANGLNEAHHRATVRAKPLPEPFASLPGQDVIEILGKATCNARTRPDPDAAIGLAIYDPRHFERPLDKYQIGFSDEANKRQAKPRIITPAEVVPDKYHFYYLGRHALSQNCLVYMSWTWRLQFKLEQYWKPGGEDKWDIYVSLKLEGPLFSDRSKSKENRVSFDRAVLVRVPKDETVPPPGLPVGAALPALPPDPFPDRMSAFVWRNWGIVGKARLAETVGARPEDVTRLATEMGLAPDPTIEPAWATHGYITVIRRNWHLLNYDQLLKLTGMDAARMKSVLLDHDFLFQKLGHMKPRCRPLLYNADEIAKTQDARLKIAEALETAGVDAAATCEPRFSFMRELTAAPRATNHVPRATSHEPQAALRLMSSYFADFGDPLGDDEIGSYPEGLLARLASEGVTAIWLPVAFKHLDARHFANARQLVTRAAKYGLGVYVYLNEPRGDGKGMCTSLTETRQYLVEKTRELFAAVPALRGALTITASENPTSCASQGGKSDCPRCKSRSFAEIVAEVNSCIAEGMHAANPKAELIVWDWGWDSCSGEDWRKLVPSVLAKLPKENVRFLTISERFVPTNRGGFPAKVNEYSISTPGPGERARACWKAAKANGLGIMAKVQASASWEFAAVPYLPCLDLVAEHAWNLARAGVGDVMLSWSVGAWPSPNLRLFTLTKTDDPSPDAALDRLATELYGASHVATARAAWKAYSDGFREFPFWSCVLHRGPHHAGPANPLYPVPTEYTATMTGIPYDDLQGWCDIYPEETWIAQMAKVRDGFVAGNRLWAAHVAARAGDAQARAAREGRMFQAVECHFASVVNQARFIQARRRGDSSEMRRLAACELTTAKTMLNIVRADSRIGYECANHYFYTPQDILEKILTCRQIMVSPSHNHP